MALTFTVVQAIKGGSPTGSNLAASRSVPGTEATEVFGSSSELWGTAWSYSDVNASNFGVQLQFQGLVNTSDGLNAAAFGFSIPSDQVIDGIQFDVALKSTGAGTASAIISVNHVTCTVTTSTGAVYTSVGSFFPFIQPM